MALDMSKYTKMAQTERKLPIIFMINEKVISDDEWEGGTFQWAIDDIMRNLSYRGVDAEIAVVSFGDEAHLRSGFKGYDKFNDREWPKTKTTGKSGFHVALTLVKDMLEDNDTTPEGNYDPVVILFSTEEVSPGYKTALSAFAADGRFQDVQRIGIADLNSLKAYYRSLNYIYEPRDVVSKNAPGILKKFAGENVALFIKDERNTSWCTDSEWDVTETRDDYTWFCPVIKMLELRYTENGLRHARPVDGDY